MDARLFGRWLIGLCWVMLLPVTAVGRSPQPSLPDGVCGDAQNMLEATRKGNAMVQQVLAAGMAWSDNSLNEYVNRLGQSLTQSSGSKRVYSFYVLYNPQVNAQAFPGGYIVINSGAISVAESEAEFASVLAHEIAHENACDWRKTPSKGNLFELIALVPALVLTGPAAIALTVGAGYTGQLARARSLRSNEERADQLATLYLSRAGYDPNAATQFFQRLQAEQECGGGEPGGLLALHPRAATRRKKLEKTIPHLPPLEIGVHNERDFLRMQQAVREYDKIYSQVVGVRVPGHDAPPPRLSRRPPAEIQANEQ